MASGVTDLSPDGRTVIFFDGLSGLTRAGNPTLFRRSTTGEAAVPVGEGAAGRLSPDGRWVLASLVQSLVLLPAGAGSAVVLPKGNLSRVGAGGWLPLCRFAAPVVLSETGLGAIGVVGSDLLHAVAATTATAIRARSSRTDFVRVLVRGMGIMFLLGGRQNTSDKCSDGANRSQASAGHFAALSCVAFPFVCSRRYTRS
jgi:hypothetical protein